MLPKGISFVLGIPMNSKSATYNVFQAEPLYQPNDDGKTASVYQFPKPYVAIATDNTNFAELAASTLQQCTGSNRIKLCRKGFSTTTDETLFCLTSLYLNQDIPAIRNCPVSSVLLPEFQKSHRQSIWQTASITSFPGTLQSTLRTIADQMDSVCLQSIVRCASFDQVVKVLFTLINAILFCHPTWTHVKQHRNRISQQSNWHRP